MKIIKPPFCCYTKIMLKIVSFVLCALCCCVMVLLCLSVCGCMGFASEQTKKNSRRPNLNARWFSVSPVGFRLIVLKSIPAAGALHKSTFTCECVCANMLNTSYAFAAIRLVTIDTNRGWCGRLWLVYTKGMFHLFGRRETFAPLPFEWMKGHASTSLSFVSDDALVDYACCAAQKDYSLPLAVHRYSKFREAQKRDGQIEFGAWYRFRATASLTVAGVSTQAVDARKGRQLRSFPSACYFLSVCDARISFIIFFWVCIGGWHYHRLHHFQFVRDLIQSVPI